MDRLAIFRPSLWLAALFYDLHIPFLTPNWYYQQQGREQNGPCEDCARERLKHFTIHFTQTNHIPPKKDYRMRGQIYSQSGSRVIWLDAFLEWSFLSILLSFSEVSPQLPPLPQHSSLLFILYKYNQTGKQPTLAYPLSLSLSSLSLSVGLSFTRTHV